MFIKLLCCFTLCGCMSIKERKINTTGASIAGAGIGAGVASMIYDNSPTATLIGAGVGAIAAGAGAGIHNNKVEDKKYNEEFIKRLARDALKTNKICSVRTANGSMKAEPSGTDTVMISTYGKDGRNIDKYEMHVPN